MRWTKEEEGRNGREDERKDEKKNWSELRKSAERKEGSVRKLREEAKRYDAR